MPARLLSINVGLPKKFWRGQTQCGQAFGKRRYSQASVWCGG